MWLSEAVSSSSSGWFQTSTCLQSPEPVRLFGRPAELLDDTAAAAAAVDDDDDEGPGRLPRRPAEPATPNGDSSSSSSSPRTTTRTPDMRPTPASSSSSSSMDAAIPRPPPPSHLRPDISRSTTTRARCCGCSNRRFRHCCTAIVEHYTGTHKGVHVTCPHVTRDRHNIIIRYVGRFSTRALIRGAREDNGITCCNWVLKFHEIYFLEILRESFIFI